MHSLLNMERPPVFCPGCSHERVTKALDAAFKSMGLPGNRVALVSDIGCSGLFDTFFNTHALHGLHGRALTYAVGLKMADPTLNVIVTMGDGGLGIGGAHVLAAARRNLDITLLVLNNFNFGMTGGQFSATTPVDATVGSGFLNSLESPLDLCRTVSAAGATYVTRCSSYEKDLPGELERAISHKGFSAVDMWGVCTGRYTGKNRWTPNTIKDSLADLPDARGVVAENMREEYGAAYRKHAQGLPPVPPPTTVEKEFSAPEEGRIEVAVLGSAGMRIVTAGDLLCLAALTAGLNTSQKNDYNITVLRGPSVSEMILDPSEIGYTGIHSPRAILALSDEGVTRRRYLFDNTDDNTLIIHAEGVSIPQCKGEVHEVNFKARGLKKQEFALGALTLLAEMEKGISLPMLKKALSIRFKGKVLDSTLELVEKTLNAEA